MRGDLDRIFAALDARPGAANASDRQRASLDPVARQEAQRSAWENVETAVSGRRWTHENAIGFTASMAVLDPAETKALLEVLVPALNRGEITLETESLFF